MVLEHNNMLSLFSDYDHPCLVNRSYIVFPQSQIKGLIIAGELFDTNKLKGGKDLFPVT